MLHFIVGKWVEERAISWRIELYSIVIYRIYFHLLPYEFGIGLIVSLEKLWNVKFQTK
jgi:hypothetical protein